MLAAESHRKLERVWQIGRQGEELGPTRKSAPSEPNTSKFWLPGRNTRLSGAEYFLQRASRCAEDPVRRRVAWGYRTARNAPGLGQHGQRFP
jgi:hypothetical protein